MFALTVQQLKDLIATKSDPTTLISEDAILHLFRSYGDQYYKEYGIAPWELCITNPYWKDKRGQKGYPRKGDLF